MHVQIVRDEMTKEQSDADRNERDIRSREEEKGGREIKNKLTKLFSATERQGAQPENSSSVLNVRVVDPPLCRKHRQLVAKNQEIRRFLPQPMLCTAATTFVIGTILPRRDAAMPIASILLGCRPPQGIQE
jgi:hypothetical protein